MLLGEKDFPLPIFNFKEKTMGLVSRKAAEIIEKTEKPVEKREYDEKDLIPTGSTLFNLACSDAPFGGWRLGKMSNLIGDSSSGKTFVALTTLAEASKLDRFKEYELIYIDVEEACEFDIPYLFGNSLYERMQIYSKHTKPRKVETIEDFIDFIIALSDAGKPYIVILDSFDALTSEDDIKKALEDKKAREKGKEPSGTYGVSKPKAFTKFCSLNLGKIAELDSFLLVVSQTRDNLGFGAMFKPKTRSGGNALKFYSTHEIWLSVDKAEKDLNLKIGHGVQAKFTKNKLTGKHRTVYFPIFYDYGIDDLTACINYLVDTNHWKKNRGVISTEDFYKLEMSMKDLLIYIEQNGKERELQMLVGKVWREREEAVRLAHRKRRFE